EPQMKPAMPPGPGTSALLTIARMSMRPYGFLEECQRRYGDAFTLVQPGVGAGVFVCEPQAVKALCTGGYDHFSPATQAHRLLLGDHAIIFQQDAEHKETRRLMMPPFFGERMRAYGADMLRLTDAMIESFSDGEQLSLLERFQDVALKVILTSVFGMSDGPR